MKYACSFGSISEEFSVYSPAQLKPWPNNPRVHSEVQLKKLERNVRTLGFINPIIVDEKGVVLAGHARLEVALRIKMMEVPVITVRGLSKTQKAAYVIADNRMTDLSAFDPEKLRIEIDTILEDGDFDVELTGFDTVDIDLMIHGDEPPEEDDPTDLQEDDLKEAPVVSCLGDIWLLGDKHRLLCGDSLDKKCYETLMQGDRAQMIFCDPPYNVPVAKHIRTSDEFDEFPMASGEMSEEEFTAFLKTFLGHAKVFSLNGSIHYVCMDWRHAQELQNAAEPVFGKPKQVCVWVKSNGGMGSFYRSQHELVFVFKNGKAAHINNFGLGDKGRYRTNVWFYKGVNSFGANREEELAMHPTVKPVQLVADAILDCSKRNGIILDPFMGSGTTIIAAEATGRTCYGIEMDARYVDVSIARWMRLHDKPVIHGITGETFEEVKARRTAPLMLEYKGGGNDQRV